jgi:uncharacterized protein YbbC (DUF1343 family)
MSAKCTIKLWMSALLLFSCGTGLQSNAEQMSTAQLMETSEVAVSRPIPAAEHLENILPLIHGKRVALVANQTSLVNGVHLVDTLLSSGIDISHVYAPEHGFRGDQADGARISDETDQKTGLKLYSLYGKSKKPTEASLAGIDVVVFDIQDVGVRFYTFISSLHYVMEACAEQGVEVIVLDRPNPLGNTIDGPVLKPKFSSFVGMHPVPLIYGMTIGEYALMINGEGWLKDKRKAILMVIPCLDYNHQKEYVLTVPPSPNLPNQASIYLYPSLALFEGTVVSVGRGTDHPFEIAGHPDFSVGSYSFTPEPNQGSIDPPLKGEQCFGLFFGPERAALVHESKELDLSIVLLYYKVISSKKMFFLESGFFDLLAGSDELRKQIESGKTESEIRASWQKDLVFFKEKRAKYLIYQD